LPAERAELVKATSEDLTLAALRKLADRESGGYEWQESLVKSKVGRGWPA